MKKTITFGLVLATLAAFFVVSCANPATGGGVTPPAPDAFPVARDINFDEMEFVGTYSSDTFTISLDGDGTGSYEYSGPAANERKAAGSGKIAWNKKDGTTGKVEVKTSKNATADTLDIENRVISGEITDGDAKIKIPADTKAVGIDPASLVGTICVIESTKDGDLDTFLKKLVDDAGGTGFAWAPTELELLANGEGTANVRIYDSEEEDWKTEGTVTREYKGKTYSITWDGNGFGTFSGVPGTWEIDEKGVFKLGGAFVDDRAAPAYIIGNKAYVWMDESKIGTTEPDLVYVEL